jgi:plastocyanin
MRKRLLVLPLAVAAAVGASVLPAGAASSISLKDNFFSPKSSTVKKGSTVTFKWTGRAPHNVTVVKGPAKFTSPTKTSGTYRRKLTRAGTYKIVCTIHPGMNLTLRVK